jgi:hypothetical protein
VLEFRVADQSCTLVVKDITLGWVHTVEAAISAMAEAVVTCFQNLEHFLIGHGSGFLLAGGGESLVAIAHSDGVVPVSDGFACPSTEPAVEGQGLVMGLGACWEGLLDGLKAATTVASGHSGVRLEGDPAAFGRDAIAVGHDISPFWREFLAPISPLCLKVSEKKSKKALC